MAGDSPVGTAPPARQWFLVEHPGPWGPLGYAGSGLDPAAVGGLTRWMRATGGRVVLVRRPGRSTARSERRWFRVDARPGRETIRSGPFSDERELADPAALAGEVRAEPLALVCAHGRHDTCCAMHGRPVAAALAAAEPDATWECSHIGGCRFAPALVLLPHGFVLGPLPEPAAAVEALARYRTGTIDGRTLRGRSSLPPAVQAAQHAARVWSGVDGVDALRVVAVDVGEPHWTVTLAGPDCVVRLTERWENAGRPLTCAATVPGRLRIYDTVSVSPRAEDQRG